MSDFEPGTVTVASTGLVAYGAAQRGRVSTECVGPVFDAVVPVMLPYAPTALSTALRTALSARLSCLPVTFTASAAVFGPPCEAGAAFSIDRGQQNAAGKGNVLQELGPACAPAVLGADVG